MYTGNATRTVETDQRDNKQESSAPPYERDENSELPLARSTFEVVRDEISKIGPPELIEAGLATGITHSVGTTLVGTAGVTLETSDSLAAVIQRNVGEDITIRAATDDPYEVMQIPESPQTAQVRGAEILERLSGMQLSPEDTVALDALLRARIEEKHATLEWIAIVREPVGSNRVSIEGIHTLKDVLMQSVRTTVLPFRWRRRSPESGNSFESHIAENPQPPSEEPVEDRARTIKTLRQRIARNPDLAPELTASESSPAAVAQAA